MADVYELDELDKRILGKLREDGRMSFREIAKEVDSTPVTVINRVDKMKDAGVIRGFGADIDYRKIGYSLVAIVEIRAKGKHITDLKALVRDSPNVVSMYEITGDTDLVLIAKFRDRDELSGFVMEELSNSNMVEKTITHLTTESYWERDGLPF